LRNDTFLLLNRNLRLNSMNLTGSARKQKRSFLAVLAGSGLLLVLILAAFGIRNAYPDSPVASRIEAKGLYQLTNIWTVHLKFSPDQWEEMEPKGGGGPFGGPGGAGPFGGPRGPRGPGGPGDGPPDFGPAMFLAPAFLRDGDSDHDGRLSR